jgi:hypothetical protein
MGTYSAVGDGTFSLPATVKRITRSGFEKVEEKETRGRTNLAEETKITP